MKTVKIEFWGGPWDGESRKVSITGPDFLLGTNGFDPPQVHVYSLAMRNEKQVFEYRGLIASSAIS